MTKQPASKIDTFWPLTAAIWRNESQDGKAIILTTSAAGLRG